MDTATGTLSTVAGNVETTSFGDGGLATSAGLYYPSSIAIDGAGNLYIADQLNRRIRKVDAQTLVTTTLAGGGEESTDEEGGPATEAYLGRPSGVCADSSGNVYIAEQRQVRKVDGAAGTISTVAGRLWSGSPDDGVPATDAQLGSPERVFVDRTNTIYVADWSDNRVRKVDPESGVISTVAGTGEEGFSGDGGPATDAALYVSSSVYSTGGGIFIDGQGDLYIADRGNHRIRRVEGVATPVKLGGESPTAKTPDFDGNGTVDFPDFVEFARNFNASEGDPGFEARFDLDGDGKVGFPDFVVFATAFGKAA